MNSLKHLVEYTESTKESVRLSSTQCLQSRVGNGTWGIADDPCPVNLNWRTVRSLWIETLEMPRDNSIGGGIND